MLHLKPLLPRRALRLERRDEYPRLCRIYLPIPVFKGIFPGSNHWLYLQPAAVVCSVLWLMDTEQSSL